MDLVAISNQHPISQTILKLRQAFARPSSLELTTCPFLKTGGENLYVLIQDSKTVIFVPFIIYEVIMAKTINSQRDLTVLAELSLLNEWPIDGICIVPQTIDRLQGFKVTQRNSSATNLSSILITNFSIEIPSDYPDSAPAVKFDPPFTNCSLADDSSGLLNTFPNWNSASHSLIHLLTYVSHTISVAINDPENQRGNPPPQLDDLPPQLSWIQKQVDDAIAEIPSNSYYDLPVTAFPNIKKSHERLWGIVSQKYAF